MPQLDPTWFASQLFWLAVCFAFLYVMLAFYILPPFLRVMDLRAVTRESDLTRAQALKDEAEAVKASYEQAMSDARARAQALFHDAEERHKQAFERSLADLQRQASANLAAAENRIAAQKEELVASLIPALGELAGAVVEKVVNHRPEPAKAQAAVQSALQEPNA